MFVKIEEEEALYSCYVFIRLSQGFSDLTLCGLCVVVCLDFFFFFYNCRLLNLTHWAFDKFIAGMHTTKGLRGASNIVRQPCCPSLFGCDFCRALWETPFKVPLESA